MFAFVLSDFHLIFEICAGFFELAHALADAACELRNLLGAEEEEDHHEDNDQFWAAEGVCERQVHGDRVIWIVRGAKE